MADAELGKMFILMQRMDAIEAAKHIIEKMSSDPDAQSEMKRIEAELGIEGMSNSPGLVGKSLLANLSKDPVHDGTLFNYDLVDLWPASTDEDRQLLETTLGELAMDHFW